MAARVLGAPSFSQEVTKKLTKLAFPNAITTAVRHAAFAAEILAIASIRKQNKSICSLLLSIFLASIACDIDSRTALYTKSNRTRCIVLSLILLIQISLVIHLSSNSDFIMRALLSSIVVELKAKLLLLSSYIIEIYTNVARSF